MVRGRLGSSTLGCLFSLLMFVGALYFGLPIGQSYWRYTQLRDTMRTAVRFAQTTTDEQIIRQVLEKVMQLELPREARRIRISRNPTTRRITLQTAWTETIALPFTEREWRFHPRVQGVF